MSLGRVDDALAELNRAIVDDPNCVNAYVNRAGIYTEQPPAADALADYQRAIDIGPELSPAPTWVARAFENSGKLDERSCKISKLLHAWTPERIGLAASRRSASGTGPETGSESKLHAGPSKCAAIPRSLTSCAHSHTLAWPMTGWQWKTRMLRSSWIRKLVGTIFCAGTPRVHLWRSTADYETLGAAVHDFSRAIELDPSVYAAYVGRGRILSDNYQEEAAIADFTRAIALDPDNPEAYLQRALAYNDSKHYQEALADLERVLKLNPQVMTLCMPSARRSVSSEIFRMRSQLTRAPSP